jgi:hypothetical protein
VPVFIAPSSALKPELTLFPLDSCGGKTLTVPRGIFANDNIQNSASIPGLAPGDQPVKELENRDFQRYTCGTRQERCFVSGHAKTNKSGSARIFNT